MEVRVHEGDITQIEADALVTAIDSGGLWYGGTDYAIEHSAGMQFHDQAQEALNEDPATKVVVASQKHQHNGGFTDVVFTIDDVNEDLKDVVRRGLDAAAGAGYRTVSMPALRLGFNIRRSEIVRATVEAIYEHDRNSDNSLEEITIVIRGNPGLAQYFRKELAY